MANSEIRVKFRHILSTYKHNYGEVKDGEPDPTVAYLLGILEALPQTAVLKALDEYFLFAPSQFFDQPTLIKLVQKHLAIDAGYDTAIDTWATIQHKIREHGKRITPDINKVANQTIEYLGGWSRLVDNADERIFVRVYEQLLHETTKGLILDAIK